MRISSTFISGAVAAVAVAGAANAAITPVVLDSFGTNFSGSLTVGGTPVSFGAFDFSPWGTISPNVPSKAMQGNSTAGDMTSGTTYATNTEGSGTATFQAIATGANLNPSTNYGAITTNFRYGASTGTAPAFFDWSSYTSGGRDYLYFDDVTEGSGGKMRISFNVITNPAAPTTATLFSAFITDVGEKHGNRWFVHLSWLKDGSGNALTTSTLNIRNVFLGFQLTSALTVGNTAQGSLSEFGLVPAPGAIALLGAAGLVGTRRRRI